MEENRKEPTPQIESRLRRHILRIPNAVFQASGIIINGRRIKSFVFTTDLAIIRNCDADAVFADIPSHRSKPSAMLLSEPPISLYFAVWAATQQKD